MNPASIAAFNTQKAAEFRGQAATTVVFDHAKTQPVQVAFSEVSGDAGLHESGQSMDTRRIGALYFPLFTPVSGAVNPPAFPPRPGHAFTITASSNAVLIGTRWQVGSFATAGNEPTIKFSCHQLQA